MEENITPRLGKLFAIAICLYTLFYLWNRLWSLQGLPKDIPWADSGFNILLRGRASIKSIHGLRQLLSQGYNDYSKEGKPFILPNIFTGHEVILPPSEMPWLLSQPSHILSQYETTRQLICADYTLLHPKIFGEGRLAANVRRYLTRTLDTFTEDIVDEIDKALEEKWGSDPTWKEICLYFDMLEIVGRVVGRVLVGPRLCSDPSYLYHSIRFARMVTVAAAFISLIPKLLRPIFAPLFTVMDKLHFKQILKKIEPIVQKRLLHLESAGTIGSSIATPNDFIQWALLDGYAKDDSEERGPTMIAQRLAVLTFAAVQSTTITITNTLFDIASAKDSYSIQDQLRKEVINTKVKYNTSKWTRQMLARMTLNDSVLRESLRLWSFASHGVTKVVMVKEGIFLPTGHHIPQGAHIGIASYGPQHDERFYPDPYVFNPCRHSQKEGPGQHQPRTMVATSEIFLPFSHGKNSCPGRFFASQQLKLLLAAVLSKYQIEFVSNRPKNYWINNTVGPDVFGKIRIRKRVLDLIEEEN